MLKVKLLDPRAQAPTIAHPLDLGFDLYAIEDVTLVTGEPTKVRTGIAVELTPAWLGGLIRDRSSMASKGVITSAGVLDPGYRGELMVVMTYTRAINEDGWLMSARYEIKAGDKIAQLVPIGSNTQGTVAVTKELTETVRGTKGFGSSGK